LNYAFGQWISTNDRETLEVLNPATQEVIGLVPLSTATHVDQIVEGAQSAFPVWRRISPNERAQYLYGMKLILEQNRIELSQLITQECGKTFDESAAEIQRAIENIEVACGIPSLMQGVISEDIAPGIDEIMLRQPVGVCAMIAPFNFPAMIPFWFLPYALACGNTVVVKPSERVPLTMERIFQLFEPLQLPAGVLNLVNGSKEAVDALLDNPAVRAISFVGSTAVARYIYSRAAANGKRAQCQGGAKNPVVILPDCDLDMTTRIVADSAFGCAGQRCLAASLAVTVGGIDEPFTAAIAEAARERVVGYGLETGVQMGPVISPTSKLRIGGLITKAVAEGAEMVVDGRCATIAGFERGNFIRPTVISGLPPEGEIASTEIFGPVLGLIHVNTVEEAIQLVNRGRYGNMACLFTNSGAAARKFRYEAEAGNVGINIGIAAPMAYFPFSGWKESFFGDLHAQSMDSIEFFTQKKVIIERWPKEWSRKF
jgi:malonate-semialdehyde dehydrogenase (acetylating)/methylmalonate-semialdehyde dehydrogenase